jgi:hypothetical protein
MIISDNAEGQELSVDGDRYGGRCNMSSSCSRSFDSMLMSQPGCPDLGGLNGDESNVRRSFCGRANPTLSPNLNLPDDGADQIDEKARRGQSGQAANVGGRVELDKVKSCDPGPSTEACDQVDHWVYEAARSTRCHARHDAGIETVAVEGDDDSRSFWNKPKSCFGALGVNLAGGHEAAAVVPRCSHSQAERCRRYGCQPERYQLMRHLARPAHGARIAVAFTIQLVGQSIWASICRV